MKIKKVIVIDPYRDESITYANQLRIILPLEFIVKEIWPPYRQLTDYLYLLDREADIACFVVEERLKKTGIATYTGYELAQFLHAHGTRLPFFLMSNFIDPLLELDDEPLARVFAKRWFRDDSLGSVLRTEIISRCQ